MKDIDTNIEGRISDLEEVARKRSYIVMLDAKGIITSTSKNSTLADYLDINITSTNHNDGLDIMKYLERFRPLGSIAEVLAKEFESVIESPEPQKFEYHGDFTITHKRKKRQFHIHFIGQPLDTGHYTFSIEDMSEVTHTKRELEETLARYIEGYSVVAHEFKSPVSSLNSIIQLLTDMIIPTFEKEYPQRDEKTTEFIEAIKSRMRRLEAIKDWQQNIIDKYLHLSRIESGTIEITAERMDLDDIATSVIARHQEQLQEKRINVFYNINSYPFGHSILMKDATVVADETVIFTVYSNLVSNVIKYAEEGSRIHLFAEDMGDRYRFSVSNSGSFIREKDKARLFRPFSKLGTGRMMHSSTGLGLYNSRRFIEYLGGNMDVESDERDWTRFYFDLPKASKAQEQK